jgi:hypothetical protein
MIDRHPLAHSEVGVADIVRDIRNWRSQSIARCSYPSDLDDPLARPVLGMTDSTGKRCANRVALGRDCKAAGASKPRVCITRIQGLTPFRFVLVAWDDKDTPMDWPGFIWGH